jgi:tRNA dimethylallyltransferase
MTTPAEDRRPLLFLVGATASGKKEAALAAAEELGVALLSLDAIKVYRGMDRGTDKSPGRRFRLTDLVGPEERFSVGDYVRAAATEVAAVRDAGKVPLFVGGTGLYLRALVRGLTEVPEIPDEVRRQVGEQLDRDGVAAGHARLVRLDPSAAARLHPHDRKRIARALEVVQATGKALSAWQRETTRPPVPGRPILRGIRWTREALHRRIRERVDRMFAAGLVEEVRALHEKGGLGPVAGAAIGYREVIDDLIAPPPGGAPRSERECRNHVATDTIAFVRRQANWFRQFPEVVWIDADDAPHEVPRRVVEEFRSALRA